MTIKNLSYEQIKTHINPEVLKDGSIFGALSEKAINFLLQSGDIMEIQKGDRLFENGDSCHGFYIVCLGSVDFYKQHNTNQIHTRTANFGEEIGFVAMIALLDHEGFAVANERSIVLKVSSGLFHKLHKNFSFDFGILTLNLARDVARTVRKLSNALVDNSKA